MENETAVALANLAEGATLDMEIVTKLTEANTLLTTQLATLIAEFAAIKVSMQKPSHPPKPSSANKPTCTLGNYCWMHGL